MSKILMSRENPEGEKLEELLAKLQVELEAKNALLDDDSCPVSRIIRHNNKNIMVLLHDAEIIQYETMERLKAIGEDTGPYGSPRIGK